MGMLHTARGLVVGDEESVGVRRFAGTADRPPLRIFYPASSAPGDRGVGWFDENGLAFVLQGYVHSFVARHDTRLFRWVLAPLVRLLSPFLTMGRIFVPGVTLGAPFAAAGTVTKQRRPVIVFSHGLFGTGEEHAVLHARWAKRGFVVVSVHHADGSSSRVPLPDGSSRYYEHGPPFAKYDATFRPRQVERRAEEMVNALRFLSSEDCPGDIRDGVDPDRTVAAGFSYGAATAALALASGEARFSGAVFLDGWFYIDVSESAGIEFDLPELAFRKGLPEIPCQFINSQSFMDIPKLRGATHRLAKTNRQGAEMHVIDGTAHQNFCDTIFWMPKYWLRRSSSVYGPADPMDAYREILDLTSDFITKIAQ